MRDKESQHKLKVVSRVTIVGALTNIILSVVKILTGRIGHSHGLVADGFHSLADLLTDGLVLLAAKFGSADADEDHPYGHGRIETVATVALALLLIVTGFGIAVDAIWSLLKGAVQTPDSYVLWVALIAVISKEALYHYTQRAANRVNSELLRANAWHHRSDAASSIVVIIGIVGSLLGYVALDALAAVFVGIMIAKMGGQIAYKNLRELVDTAVEPDLVEKMRAHIQSTDGVVAVHQLRTRLMSGDVLVDVHVQVAPQLSVSEGHHISHRVHMRLTKAFPSVKDVTVHIDPENDEIAEPCHGLPSREAFLPEMQRLLSQWQAIDAILAVNLHYLSGKIVVEIVLPQTLQQTHSATQLEADANSYLQAVEYISVAKLYFTTK